MTDLREAEVAAIRGGDVSALRRLYDRTADKALAIALRILRNRAEAEDVVQETFVEVWKRAGDFDPARGRAAAWVATIARTRAIDRLRARQTATRAAEAASAEPPPSGSRKIPSNVLERSREQVEVAEALKRLPSEQRVALELAFYDGLTQREIAEQTGEPLGTIKTRVRLGMEKLSDYLSHLEVAP